MKSTPLCGVIIFVVVLLSEVVVLKVLKDSISIGVGLDGLNHEFTLAEGDLLGVSSIRNRFNLSISGVIKKLKYLFNLFIYFMVMQICLKFLKGTSLMKIHSTSKSPGHFES